MEYNKLLTGVKREFRCKSCAEKLTADMVVCPKCGAAVLPEEQEKSITITVEIDEPNTIRRSKVITITNRTTREQILDLLKTSDFIFPGKYREVGIKRESAKDDTAAQNEYLSYQDYQDNDTVLFERIWSGNDYDQSLWLDQEFRDLTWYSNRKPPPKRQENAMPFRMVSGNIWFASCDAIVVPFYEDPQVKDDTDILFYHKSNDDITRAIMAESRTVLTPLKEGDSRYRIHVLVPKSVGTEDFTDSLRTCYQSALQIASDYHFQQVAFPLIGSVSDYPKELALQVAEEEIKRFLIDHEDIHIVLFVHDMSIYYPNSTGSSNPADYIEDQKRRMERQRKWKTLLTILKPRVFFAVLSAKRRSRKYRRARKKMHFAPGASYSLASDPWPSEAQAAINAELTKSQKRKHKDGLNDPQKHSSFIKQFGYTRTKILDESFSQMVLRVIDEKGLKDPDVYRKANMDKRLFSKLRSNKDYHPKKTTALALAVALELTVDETKELLLKAGYGLSPSIPFDIIVEFFLRRKEYNIYIINEQLFKYDQPLLGG